jgi:hypothetical protein
VGVIAALTPAFNSLISQQLQEHPLCASIGPLNDPRANACDFHDFLPEFPAGYYKRPWMSNDLGASAEGLRD